MNDINSEEGGNYRANVHQNNHHNSSDSYDQIEDDISSHEGGDME